MKKLEFNRNEQLFGPAPAVLDVLRNFKSEHIYRYEDGYYNSLLRPHLAHLYVIPEEQIIVGYGAEDIFRTIFDRLNPGDCVLTSQFYFIYYQEYLRKKDIPLHVFSMNIQDRRFLFDIDHCLVQYHQLLPKVVIITSPNNPTGNSISAADLERILEAVSKKTLVVLDEAYWGFSSTYDQVAFFALLHKYPNLIIVRTFSKLYGLAGLRIGYAFCGKHVKSLLRYQEPYLGMSYLIEKAAIAALYATDYYNKVAITITQERDLLIHELNSLPSLTAYESEANFIAVRVPDSGVTHVRKALEHQDIIVSKFVSPDLMRVSIGLPEYNQRFLETLHNSL